MIEIRGPGEGGVECTATKSRATALGWKLTYSIYGVTTLCVGLKTLPGAEKVLREQFISA